MIVADKISVSYGHVEVLNSLSFQIKHGSVLAVMGRNGVGKTTLMKTIMGLIPKSSGTLHFKKESICSDPPYHRARRGIGYVPQGRHIFPRLTVEENLKTGLHKSRKAIPEEVYHFFPVLRDMSQRFGGDLSGGQQQQLSIARALVTDPELLILDEPTEGIQPNIIQKIGEVLRYLSQEKKMTIVIVEQYLDFIREFTDEFMILNRGQRVAQGPTEALSTELIENYLHV